MIAPFRSCIPLLTIFGTASGLAQTSTPSWIQLQAYETEDKSAILGNGTVIIADASGNPLTTGPAAQLCTRYFSHASDLAAFIKANPTDSRDSEARRLEAEMLADAELYGNFGQETLCDSLVATVAADTTLPEPERCSLVLLTTTTEFQHRGYTSATASGLTQMEQSLRAIVAEFPNSPPAYLALLTFARCAPEIQAKRIVGDLIGGNAPSSVVAQAQLLLNRFNLEGKSLRTIFAGALPAASVPNLPIGHVVIVYGWSIVNPASDYTAADIQSRAPAGATIVGINLDADVAAALAAATAKGYPGVQLYDPAGVNSTLAKGLYLGLDNVVLIANRSGIITAVAGAHAMASDIAAGDQ
jgi:hypothetical protein